jgi:hypothetical protein
MKWTNFKESSPLDGKLIIMKDWESNMNYDYTRFIYNGKLYYWKEFNGFVGSSWYEGSNVLYWRYQGYGWKYINIKTKLRI